MSNDQAQVPVLKEFVVFTYVACVVFLMSAVTLLIPTGAAHTILGHFIYCTHGLLDNFLVFFAFRHSTPLLAAQRSAVIGACFCLLKVVVIATDSAGSDPTCSWCALFLPSPSAVTVDLATAGMYAVILLLHACAPRLRRSFFAPRRSLAWWTLFMFIGTSLTATGGLWFDVSGERSDGAICVMLTALVWYSAVFPLALYSSAVADSAHWHIRDIQAPLLGDTERELSVGSTNTLLRVKFVLQDMAVRMIEYRQLTLAGKIGSGGYAEVYKGTYKGQPVAVKRLTKLNIHHLGRANAAAAAAGAASPGGSGSNPVDDFLKEVSLMMKLRHPHILLILGVSATPTGSLCILTEFCSLGSVYGILHNKSSQFTLRDTLRTLTHCARGMAYLHRLEPIILHRDLKCQNLLVDADWMVKCADFGLSREVYTGAMTQIGTVQWAAPELLLGVKYSAKVDVWSFGVVAWECLTRKVPFKGLSTLQIGRGVAYQGLRLKLPPVPKKLHSLIRRCWKKEPTLRPSFSSILHRLGEITAEYEEKQQNAARAAAERERAQKAQALRQQQQQAQAQAQSNSSSSSVLAAAAAAVRSVSASSQVTPSVASSTYGGAAMAPQPEFVAAAALSHSPDTRLAIAGAWQALLRRLGDRPPHYLRVALSHSHDLSVAHAFLASTATAAAAAASPSSGSGGIGSHGSPGGSSSGSGSGIMIHVCTGASPVFVDSNATPPVTQGQAAAGEDSPVASQEQSLGPAAATGGGGGDHKGSFGDGDGRSRRSGSGGSAEGDSEDSGDSVFLSLFGIADATGTYAVGESTLPLPSPADADGGVSDKAAFEAGRAAAQRAMALLRAQNDAAAAAASRRRHVRGGGGGGVGSDAIVGGGGYGEYKNSGGGGGGGSGVGDVVASVAEVSCPQGMECAALRGVASVVGARVPVVGGALSAQSTAFVLPSSDAASAPSPSTVATVAVSLLAPSVETVCVYASAFCPTSFEGVVTSCDARRIIAIDGAPAAAVYNRWTSGSFTAHLPPSLAPPSSAPSDSSGWVCDSLAVSRTARNHPLGRERGADPSGFPLHLTFCPSGFDSSGALLLGSHDIAVGDTIHLYSGSRATVDRFLRLSLSSQFSAHNVTETSLSAVLCHLSTRFRHMPSLLTKLTDITGQNPFLGLGAPTVQGTFFSEHNAAAAAAGAAASQYQPTHTAAAAYGAAPGGGACYGAPQSGQGMVSMALFTTTPRPAAAAGGGGGGGGGAATVHSANRW